MSSVEKQASSLSREHALDGWRGVACLAVVAQHSHLQPRVGEWPLLGNLGVHLFFILSGYLIGKPYLRALLRGERLPGIGGFYMRRLLRIYPPYLVSLLFFPLRARRRSVGSCRARRT